MNRVGSPRRAFRAMRIRKMTVVMLLVVGIAITFSQAFVYGSGALVVAAGVGVAGVLTWILPVFLARIRTHVSDLKNAGTISQAKSLKAGGYQNAAALLLLDNDALGADAARIHGMARALRQEGFLNTAVRLFEEAQRIRPVLATEKEIPMTLGQLALLSGEDGAYVDPADLPGLVEGRVLHVVKRSILDAQAGYTLRTHNTAIAQVNRGTDTHVVSQMGIHVHAEGDQNLSVVDGVTYHLLAGPRQSSIPDDEWFRLHVDELATLVRELRPMVLHAASDFVNARAARLVGSAYGIPVIYEVRGFWEETLRSSLDRRFGRSVVDGGGDPVKTPDTYSLRRNSEIQERLAADAIVTLAPVMAKKIIDEGALSEKITIVPNAVDPAAFEPSPRDQDLLREVGVDPEARVIGYISSLSEYEGVDVLIHAFAALRERAEYADVALVIVGDGNDRERLEAVADEVGALRIFFTGRVPHSEVRRYYSIMDIFVVPRLPVDVCHLVTPLKPYEAFALGKSVLMSDVRALAGIAQESGGAVLARAGDPTDFARALSRLLDDPAMRAELADRGREWVTAERTWDHNAVLYETLYESLRKVTARRVPDAH